MTKQTSIKIPRKEELFEKSGSKWAIKTIHHEVNKEVVGLFLSNSDVILYQNLAYAMLIPILSLLLSTGITVIPQHNVFEQPGYWYETAIPFTTSILPAIVGLTILRMKVFFSEVHFKMSTWIKFYAANSIYSALVIFLPHFIWTDYLGYTFPIPLFYILVSAMMWPFLLPLFFLIFPREFRADEKLRNRIKWFMVYKVWSCIAACFERLIVIFCFLSTPIQAQPMWAIFLPLLRKFDNWLLSKLLKKTAGPDNRDAKIFTCLENQSNHAAVLAITLGLYATEFSCYCILIAKYILKLHTCYGIYKISKKIETKEGLAKEELKRTKEESTQSLMLDEAVEVMMPIVYGLTILLAYYGPNSAILGNVGCEIWKWQKITNLTMFLTGLFRMFTIDFIALILNGLLLWNYCSVNVMRQLCIDVKSYWPFISVAMGGAVIKVMINF